MHFISSAYLQWSSAFTRLCCCNEQFLVLNGWSWKQLLLAHFTWNACPLLCRTNMECSASMAEGRNKKVGEIDFFNICSHLAVISIVMPRLQLVKRPYLCQEALQLIQGQHPINKHISDSVVKCSIWERIFETNTAYQLNMTQFMSGLTFLLLN